MTPANKPAIPTSPPDVSQAPLRVESREILQGASTVEIQHGGQRYLLRVTRENKLILTK